VAAPPLKFDAAPWTVQTGSVAFQTTSTYTIIGMDGLPVTVINTFTTTSTQMGTGSVSGSRITLVTPTWVDALNNLLPVFTTFTIQFVPEPGTLLLLIFSSAGLGVAGGLSSWRPKRTTRKGSVEITQPVREDDEVFRVSD
jgi:hypothetical protein